MALDNIKLSQITETTTSSSEDEFHRVNGNSRRIKRRNLGGASLSYFVNLLSGDTGDPELDRVFAAVNDNGVTGYARTKGEDMYFYTYQQSRTDNTDIEQRFYKVKITDDNIGGSAGIQLTADDLQPSGSLIINLTDQPSLEIDLGDIGATAVETAFNADPAEPFTIAGLQFITALQNDVETAWIWVGGDGTFGASGTPAVAGDFNLLGVSEIPIDETTPKEGAGLAPDTIIKLDNWEGREYFMGAATAITTFTYSDEVLKGKARHLINAASEPVVTGATKVNGDTFQVSTNMYMHTEYNGTRVEYYFKAITTGSSSRFTVMNGLITQTGTNNPVVTVGYNDTGLTPTFVRNSTGFYEWDVSAESFTPEKLSFILVINSVSVNAWSTATAADITIRTFNTGLSAIDGGLTAQHFEFKIYN